MFSCQIFAKPFLILVGLTAASYINAAPPALTLSPGTPVPASSDPANGTSKPDPATMHCVLTQYIPWVRAQGRPLDPDLKAKKLQEIDKACGSSLHLSNVITAYDSLPGATQEPKQPAAAVIPAAPAAPAAKGPTFSELVDGPLDNLEAYLSRPGIDVNERKANFETLLDVAADHNKTLAAKFLLDHGADIDASPPHDNRYHGNTALYHAAYMNSLEVAELLIARGATVDSHQESYGSHTATPLCAAGSQGNLQMVVMLLNHGAEVDAEFGVHQTPLSEALAHGHMDAVRALMDHGAKLRPQYLATVALQGRVEATKLLLTQPMDQATKDDALRLAILGGPEHTSERIQIVQDLLNHGANIDNLKSVPDVIPAMFAATPDMAEFLFAHGANREAKLPGAQIAKAFVCNDRSKDTVAMLQVLIAHGLDIGGTTSQGSALLCAKRANNQALLSFLEQHHVGVSGANTSAPSAASVASAMQPPNVTITQNGKVTNLTMTGQLAAKHPLDCVSLTQVDNTRTPPDLYLGVSACILKDDYRTAVALFALAGVESRFDAERVLDKSAGQAGPVLIMNTFNGLPDDKREKFGKTVGELAVDPQALAHTCSAIRKIGYPTYYPEYMVLHGIHAFTAKAGDPTLQPNFDAHTVWNSLLTSYLSCHDAPIQPTASPVTATPSF
jgi:ankyrin repeat protein